MVTSSTSASSSFKFVITYSSVSIVLQVVVRDSPVVGVLDCVGEQAHPDLVIAAECEGAPSGMLSGGRGAGKINVYRRLSDATAKLK